MVRHFTILPYLNFTQKRSIDSDIGLRNEVQTPRKRLRIGVERWKTDVKRPRIKRKRPRIEVERSRWRDQGLR